MANVGITVESDADAYSVWVDGWFVEIRNGRAFPPLHLAPGDHTITWVIIGPAGKSIKITVTVEGGETASFESAIPKGATHYSDVDEFAV